MVSKVKQMFGYTTLWTLLAARVADAGPLLTAYLPQEVNDLRWQAMDGVDAIPGR